MGKTTEEIKILITGDASKLNRELTSAEKAVLRAKGVVQDASGAVSGSSASWKKYRTAVVSEMEKALEGVRKTQAKIRALKEQQMQAVGLSDTDMGDFISASRQMGSSDADIQSMVDYLRQPSPAAQEAYKKATAELETYKQAAEDAAQSVQWLNQKVEESAGAEQEQARAAKEAAQSAKEQARSAREAASTHSESARASNLSRSGLARFGRTAVLAMIGVRTLYAGLRRLVTALLETAKADSSLSTSLGQIKGNLGIAFQSIYQAALPALRALANILATVTSYVAKLMAMLFNVSWAAASEGAENYASSVGGAGAAAEKAARNMMAFDELNVMNSEDDSSGGGGSSGITPIFGDEPDTPEWMEKVKAFFTTIREDLEKVKALWVVIKESFKSAWDNKGAALLGVIHAILLNVFSIIGNIAEAWGSAWQDNDSGRRIFEALVGIATELLGIVEDITAAIKKWSETADFSPLTNAFAYLFEAVERLVGSIRDALQPIWEAFFGPSMDFSINALSLMINWLGVLVDVISIVVSAIGILIQAVSSGFTFVYDVLNGMSIKDAGAKFSEDFMDGFETNWANIKESAYGIGEGIGSAIDTGFTSKEQRILNTTGKVFNSIGEGRAIIDATKTSVNKLRQELESLPKLIDIKVNIKTSGSLNYIKGGSYATAYARGGVIRAAAGGGGFTTGQLFIAREAGPELVAGIGGGKTAVMNNNQIVQSVSDGVYKAVVEAMSTMQGSDSGDFVVKIGERELVRVMRKAERSSGYQISGNPSFAR